MSRIVRIHWVSKTVSNVKITCHSKKNIVVNEERDNQNIPMREKVLKNEGKIVWCLHK